MLDLISIRIKPSFLRGLESMAEADLKINSKVRKILVESGLDTSALSLSTTSGAVRIRGEMRKLSGDRLDDRRVTRLLTVLETTILRTKGVKRVTFSIEKWHKKKGKWLKQDE